MQSRSCFISARALFPAVKEAVASLIDVRTLRWIGFSYFEADECGSLPEWQQLAPQAEAVCSLVGKLVSVDDCLAVRPAKGMADGEVLQTGTYRFRFLATHVYTLLHADGSHHQTAGGPAAEDPGTMHGSVYVGDGSKALHDLATVFREVLGSQ